MNWITPFAYIDDAGEIHLCCDKVCDDLGWPKTPENLRLVGIALRQQLRRACPESVMVDNVERHLAEHPELIEKE